MQKKFLIILFFFCASHLFAQKPVIDSTAYGGWTSLGSVKISNDGKYAMYNVIVGKRYPEKAVKTVIQSTQGNWQKELPVSVDMIAITPDSKYALWNGEKDGLTILTLGSSTTSNLRDFGGSSYHRNGSNEWLSCTPADKNHVLLLHDLKTGKERSYSDVLSSEFSEDNKLLFLKTEMKENDKTLQAISWIDMATGRMTQIWKGAQAGKLVLDTKHKQLAFNIDQSVWYYKFGSAGAVCISNGNPPEGMTIGSIGEFSNDGDRLFISLQKQETPKSFGPGVQIWSYTDAKLQSEQETGFSYSNYPGVIRLSDKKIISFNDQPNSYLNYAPSSDTIALIEHSGIGSPEERDWNITSERIYELVSAKSGIKTKLDWMQNNYSGRLSSNGRFLIYFNFEQKNFYSYEISTGLHRNLTKGINTEWTGLNDNDRPDTSARGISYAVWLKNDEAFLLYDQHDIWKLDPLNKQAPINMTRGYGKKNNIIFNFAMQNADTKKVVEKNERIILSAFNKDNKKNGFYAMNPGKAADPELLTMGDYLYVVNGGNNYTPQGSDFEPIKAKDAETYIVRRMSATEAPNYFSTNDFKTFKQLSELNPGKKYNWYTSELHTWKSLDGRNLQGILYKPENFDPNKKYPVIFYYYERKSDGLNAYLTPEALSGWCQINIPTYVSQGYLVFSPDIYYTVGDPMQGTYDAVVSAAKYVSGLPFADEKKMGIQGCSYGGFQTNYLVTHTNLFAAAASSCGVADLPSAYGSLMKDLGGDKDASSQQSFYEGGQIRMGGSLWEKPQSYFNNSSTFQIHKVTTPILIMQGKKDGICLYTNIMEFFTGLRRMGKRAWMLVYPDAGHGVDGKDADDFSIRMMQFFDHYLKDKPAPVCKTRGINADNRASNGYEYDMENKTPGPGLLNPKEQAKADSLMTAKPYTITFR